MGELKFGAAVDAVEGVTIGLGGTNGVAVAPAAAPAAGVPVAAPGRDGPGEPTVAPPAHPTTAAVQSTKNVRGREPLMPLP